MKLIDVEKHLRQHECDKVREGGNHTIWKNTKNGKITSVPRHKEIKDLLVKNICKQLDIPSP